MINRRAIAAMLLAGSMMAALPGCGNILGKQYPTYRYRLTVEIDTPEGLRTGSSVIEVHTGRAWQYSIPNPGMLWISTRGEAVSVDLGRRGVLFALLRSEQLIDWASTVLFLAAPQVPLATTRGLPNSSHLDFDLRFKAALALAGAQVIPRDYPDRIGSRHKPGDPPSAWPMMVRFRDLADPKSVEKINPDDLSASFGAGVKLRRITAERTDDPVTSGILARLPWLDSATPKSLDDDFEPTTTPTFAQRIAFSDFVKERHQ
ncbi:MAG: hypothetical protein B7Y43_08780 [Sphingomonas sp. 28-62-20]|uniref:hypothetical protein n=1 Tax=Sphingomonas sp. 28-62-20 TaxID=1970433 RepID=UPI000BD319B5|nr:MAG: hypothetical protein B7Y43_08780 [Sphingomonas sp. 28-62-20]